MFIESFGEDHYIVHVYYDFSFINEVMEYVIHHCLEGCR